MSDEPHSLDALVTKEAMPMFSLRYGDGNRLLVPYHTFSSASFKPAEKTLVINAAGQVITMKCERWGAVPAVRTESEDSTAQHTVHEPSQLLDYLEVLRIRSITVGGDIEIEIKDAFEQEMEAAERKADGFGGYEPPAEPHFDTPD